MNAPALPPLPIRPARESDDGFIVDSWRESFRADSEIAKVSADVYRRVMYRHIRRLAREPGAGRLVCVDPKDDDTLLGFVVFSGSDLHYVYVRKDFRRAGIARALVEAIAPAPTSFTIITDAFARRMRPLERGWRHTPRQTL